MDSYTPSSPKHVYLSYRDDDEKIITGYFDIIEETDYHIKFRTKSNIVTISRNRIIKIKESI